MQKERTDVEEFLDEHGIEYKKTFHKAVFTVEESKKIDAGIKGIHTKNLFIKDEKSETYFLVCIIAEKRANLKDIAQILGVKRLTFAKEDKLKEYLGLTPGSVSIFGLINDVDNKVTLLLDKDIKQAKIVNFHPNINTATLSLTNKEFEKFLNTLENKTVFRSL